MLLVGVILAAGCASEPTGLAESGATSDDAAPSSDSAAGSDDDGTDTGADTPAPGASSAGLLSDGPVPSSIDGIMLDGASIVREGSTMTVNFTLSSTRSSQYIWTYELSGKAAADRVGLPAGITVIDPEGAEVHGALTPDDKPCVCSALGTLKSGTPSQYFVVFDDIDVTDFELAIPTFPLLAVRDDMVVGATDLTQTGVAVDATSSDGVVLDAVAVRRLGQLTLVELQMSNPGDSDVIWIYQLSSKAAADEVAAPTGVTLFDSSTQELTEVYEPSGRACACSPLGTLPDGGSATYFVFLEAVEGDSTSINVPGFPLLTGIPIT